MTKLTVTCRDFKPLHRNSLRGFATIRINEMRLEIRDVAIHEKGESRWAQLPVSAAVVRAVLEFAPAAFECEEV
jgi:hypothetical protein